MQLPAVLRRVALLSVALVSAMIVVFVITGVGQDPLQYVHPPNDYQAFLLAKPWALRLTVGLDDLFVVTYEVVFLLLAIHLLRTGAARVLVHVGAGALLLVGLLDFAENFHFLGMLAAAEQGHAPSHAAIEWQAWESTLKFHVSYFGLFVLGLTFPSRTRPERWLRGLTLYVQLPVGIAVHVAPRALAVPLVFARFGYFVTALVLVAWAFGPRREGKEARTSTEARPAPLRTESPA